MCLHLDKFNDLFHKARTNVCGHFNHYLLGLLASEHKKENIEVICKKLDINYQSLHHFISDSPWDHRKFFERSATLTNEIYKKVDEPIVLAIDETSFLKKGKHSAGVGRQYLGCRQGESNGQVIVCSSLVQGTNTNLIDAELYVPKDFKNDHARMKGVGMDPETFVFKTKQELAQEQISNVLKLGIVPEVVVADALYGGDSKFRKFCRGVHINYLMPIKSNTKLWFSEPENSMSERAKITDYKLNINKDTVLDKVRFISNKVDPKKVKKRTDSEVISMPVWTYNQKDKEITKEYLIVILDKDKKQYVLSNIEVTKDNIKHLVFLYRRRYFIERAFQNGKQLFGMEGFQVRKYRALMHHLAAVSVLGLHFLEELYTKITEVPKISYQALHKVYTDFINQLIGLGGSLKRQIDDLVDLLANLEKKPTEPVKGN